MRVIALKTLKKFWAENPAAQLPLNRWYQITTDVTWANFAEVKNSFPPVDQYGSCYIFDIGGNKFRLIAKIQFPRMDRSGHMAEGRVYVRAIMTHAEYKKNKWRSDCGA